jgi:undecaprenyl-diphosphatase
VKKLAFLLCLFIIGLNLYSQSIYTLDIRRDIVISTLSIGVFVTPFFISDDHDIPTDLNRRDVNIFDRWSMFPFNHGFQLARIPLMIVYNTSIIVPPLILSWMDQSANFDVWLTYGVMFTQAIFLTYGTKEIIGRSVNRYRPYLYFDGSYNFPMLDGRSNRSFPSGGAAVSFMPATFLSVTFSQEFPCSRWRIPVIVGSYTLASVVGATRILSGDHFLTDVLAGAAIGSFYGWLIPTLHNRINNDKITLYSTINGVMVSLKF